jgi:hypothetical protein
VPTSTDVSPEKWKRKWCCYDCKCLVTEETKNMIFLR